MAALAESFDILSQGVMPSPVLESALRGLCVPLGQQKTLEPWLFYDACGSRLFEQITRTPEYYITRTEREILLRSSAEIVAAVDGPVTVTELGAGSAAKTGVLLKAAVAKQSLVHYQAIDVSDTALRFAAAQMAARLRGVVMHCQAVNYVTQPYEITRRRGEHVLAMYIGSSIGNFEAAERVAILTRLREQLQDGDRLVLGVDLAPGATKPVKTLLAAYNDAAGVTASFNKNVLVRLNRELRADFDVNTFEHRAVWNPKMSRMEMHLESRRPQMVRVAEEPVAFREGETIHTENSYKFTDAMLAGMLREAGFAEEQRFLDAKELFAVVVAGVE